MKKFENEHKEAFGDSSLPKGGYPDSGNGRYAKELEYGDWFRFNVSQ